ncbi:Rap1a/Tai family immunity protein [Burkholderia metallica]|uniref:Rap1a/Tai family immunity protein n=1 Tax=Burkholderia metallica TaxID=488729 RepID=UPI00157B10BD
MVAATTFSGFVSITQARAATPSADVYRPLTAEALLSGIDNGTLAGPEEGEVRQRTISTNRATSFIYGVADTTAGKAWCPPPKMATTELVVATYGYLTKLPSRDLDAPAATMITQALKTAYPCRR